MTQLIATKNKPVYISALDNFKQTDSKSKTKTEKVNYHYESNERLIIDDWHCIDKLDQDAIIAHLTANNFSVEIQ